MKKFTILSNMKRTMFCFMFSLALVCLMGNNAKAQTVYQQNTCSSSDTLLRADTCVTNAQISGSQYGFLS